MDFMEFGKSILAIAGAVLILYNAGNVIFRITTPAVSMKRKIEEHDKKLQDMEGYFKNDLERFERIEAAMNGLIQADISIMNHMIDGNNTDRMKKTRDDLVELMKGI